MKEEKAFLLSIVDNTGESTPESVIVAKNGREALRVIEGLEGYFVGGKEISFSMIGCQCKCDLREIPLIRAEEKVSVG